MEQVKLTGDRWRLAGRVLLRFLTGAARRAWTGSARRFFAGAARGAAESAVGAAAAWFVLLLAAPAAGQLAPHATLSLVSDGNPATDDRGWGNVEINATAFKNQSLVTVGDYQFVSYYAADQTLVVGRRNLLTNPQQWFLLRTGETSANINDSHNVSTIGVDGSGRLHVAWGVHGNPLRYMRTAGSVLSDDPFTMPGNTANQIPLQSSSITYPEFYDVPDSNDLLLAYRTGSSGNGEYQLARWNDAGGAWNAVHAVVNSGSSNTGPQPWIDNDFSSTQAPPNANAYHNGLVYDSQGRLHTTWTWRTGGDSTSGFADFQSNHNLMYAYSDNDGVDWRLQDGSLLTRNGNHDIDENNATPALAIPEGSSLINQASSAVGPDDQLYVATWFAPGAASGNHTRQYMVLQYDGAAWQQRQVGARATENGGARVPESQLGAFRMSRPIVMTDQDNRLLVVYSDHQRGQGVTVAYSESAARDDWQFLDLAVQDNMRLWEPKYDGTRWSRDGILSMLYQPGGGLGPQDVEILEWNARSFFSGAAPDNFRLVVDRRTGAASLVNPDGTAATLKAYSIGSASGSLSPGGWSSVSDQQIGGWVESSAAATLLAESDATAALVVSGGGQQSLGAPFAPQYAVFGAQETRDLVFQFQRNDGSLAAGTVEYVGANLNTLALLVDPTTGRTEVRNTSPFTVAIDGYVVASAGGALSPAGWSSLDDQNAGGGDWAEAGAATTRVAELKPTSALTLTPGQGFALGNLFSPAAGSQALTFEFVLAGESEPRSGVVLFETLPAQADFNADGAVDGADLLAWQRGQGTPSAVRSQGDANLDGAVDGADLALWQASFGAGAAIAVQTAVPEPTTTVPIGLILGVAARLRGAGCLRTRRSESGRER